MPAALLPSLLLEATVAAAAAMTIESVHDHAISAIYYYVDLATLDARFRSTAQAACRAREDGGSARAGRESGQIVYTKIPYSACMNSFRIE